MSKSPRFDLPLLQTAQAGKEITHNEALILIDALMHARAESATRATPPVDPAAGQMWLIADAALDDWSGRDGDLAIFTEGGWRFVSPVPDMALWVADQALPARYNGAQWRIGPVTAGTLEIAGRQVVGPQRPAVVDPEGGTVQDSQCRAALSALLSALRAHGLIAGT